MRVFKIILLTLCLLLISVMNHYDKVFFLPQEGVEIQTLRSLVYGQSFEERIPKLITVVHDGVVRKHLTLANTPFDALMSLGYEISNKNKVTTTSPLDKLYDNAYISIESYKTTIDDITLSVPYEKIVKGGTLCQKLSEEILEQKGVLGVMTQKVKKVYERGELVAQEVLQEDLISSPIKEIVIIKGPYDSPSEVPQRGYSCSFWEAYVDNIVANDEEKQWMKFTMRLESGCNAENNRNAYYKGLLQWDPCLWYKQYPNESIFDGTAQIKHTLEKIRGGANPKHMWPNVYKKYVERYGELSWL